MAANKGLQMAKKPTGGVRRQGETKAQFRARMAGQDNSDIDAVFRGVRQIRPRIHKGLSGMQLNPDGTDPGNSFDRFMRQNPHLGGAAQRQAQYDQQARGNAYQQAAQNSLMRAQDQQPTSKSVVGADGYRSIFDSSGNAVGTTAPVGSGQSMVFDDALGEMVPMSAWSQRKDYVQGTKGMGPTPMQQAASRSVSKPSGMDQIFGGGAKQPSPSGVAGGGVVEPPQPKGAPGGELFGQMPEFRSSGMAMPQQKGPVYPPNAGPQQSDTLYPFQYGNMAQPAYGTLAEKESARRKALAGSKGAVGSYGEWIEDKTTSMEKAIQDMLRSSFGDPTLQTTNQAMQDPMQQQLNLGSAIPWLANLVPMTRPKTIAPQPINEAEALDRLEQLLRNPTQLSTPLQATFDQARVKGYLNTMSNMQFRMADLYPGSDYARIEQVFPGFKFNNYATTDQALDALRQLLSMYQ